MTRMKMLRVALFAGVIAGPVMNAAIYSQEVKWSPDQVYYGSGGKLVYAPDEKGNVIPDFSHVGYMYGDEAIPDVQVIIEVSPVEGDDRATIQAAIDQVSAMPLYADGFRGAVLLKKGTYQVKGQLFIKASGVVLRGEGQTDEGTVVIADGTGKRDFIVIGAGGGRKINTGSKVTITEEYVPLGRKFVVVNDASGFSKGDHIALYRPGTANWISDLKMDQIPDPDGTTTQWKPSSYSFYFERLVTKVSGDTIFFRNPVVMAMETNYGGGFVYKSYSERIKKVGVEDLCLKSYYRHETDEDHAWTAVAFNSIEHGWARRITSWYFGYACASIYEKARLITVEDAHCRDPKSEVSGGRRYSFNISGSLNLVKNCSADKGRHDFATGSRVCGPNVFSNCTATNATTDIGPHHRWAMGTLYEVIETNSTINVQDRANSGSGHGWAGANQVFWNCKAASSICQNPWVSAKNYNFGFIGTKDPGRYSRPDGVWVGHNRPGIFPQSLYQAQLDSRRGTKPIFSVYPKLEKVNDSAFVLSFTMPYYSALADPLNFSIAGDAGYEGAAFSATVLSDTSIMMVLVDGITPLPAFSYVTVRVNNMISSSGKTLEGLNTATYYEPDLRPLVTAEYANVNNEDGVLEAASTKPGVIYLVKFTGNYYYLDEYTTIGDLEQAVANNLGRKTDAPVAGLPVSISTKGLPGGFYMFYAVDLEGRISLPSDTWSEVMATGPLLGVERDLRVPDFSVWPSKRTIYIQPLDLTTGYAVQVFDMTGRLINGSANLRGDHQVILQDDPGFVFVTITVGDRLNSAAFKLFCCPLI
jgi:hypothetical protein